MLLRLSPSISTIPGIKITWSSGVLFGFCNRNKYLFTSLKNINILRSDNKISYLPFFHSYENISTFLIMYSFKYNKY